MRPNAHTIYEHSVKKVIWRVHKRLRGLVWRLEWLTRVECIICCRDLTNFLIDLLVQIFQQPLGFRVLIHGLRINLTSGQVGVRSLTSLFRKPLLQGCRLGLTVNLQINSSKRTVEMTSIIPNFQQTILGLRWEDSITRFDW